MFVKDHIDILLASALYTTKIFSDPGTGQTGQKRFWSGLPNS